MDKLLDAFSQPKLNQGDINHLNRSITSNDIEAVIQSLPKKNSPGPDGFLAEFHQSFTEELYQSSSNFSRKEKGKKHYQTLSMKPV
jgi:hypothetical protein